MGLAERASKTVALGVALEVRAGWFHPVQYQRSLALCQGVCLYFLRSCHRWIVPICLLGMGSARFPPAKLAAFLRLGMWPRVHEALAVLSHACNPNTWEGEEGGSRRFASSRSFLAMSLITA